MESSYQFQLNSQANYFPQQVPAEISQPVEPSPIYTTYENLPNYAEGVDLNQAAELIKSKFEDKNNWKSQFEAIDHIRIINKYYPSQINNIFIAFGVYIVENLENQKTTSVFRNSLFLLKEIFRNCQNYRIADEILQKMIPVLLSKITSEKQIIKEEIKAIFEEICKNCVYESTFVTLCQLCFDKNCNVAETALKILARMINAIGVNFMKLSSGSLQIIFKTFGNLLDEKKINLKNANLRTWTVEICNFIYKMIGVENFVNFLNVLLTKEESDSIKIAMEKPIIKKESKKSRVSFGDYIKQKREVVNFNSYSTNNGYVIPNYDNMN